MSIFVAPTPAPKPKTKDVHKIALFYAAILVVMGVAQLFTFDTFLALVASFGYSGGEPMAYLLAALLVSLEVFALPFLLRMALSPAFRWVSMVAGWLVAVIWFVTSTWLVLTSAAVESIGFLGTTVPIMPGWWAIFMSLSFGILAAWASWGMWPGKKRQRALHQRG
jgi:hypothetical protein